MSNRKMVASDNGFIRFMRATEKYFNGIGFECESSDFGVKGDTLIHLGSIYHEAQGVMTEYVIKERGTRTQLWYKEAK